MPEMNTVRLRQDWRGPVASLEDLGEAKSLTDPISSLNPLPECLLAAPEFAICASWHLPLCKFEFQHRDQAASSLSIRNLGVTANEL